MFGQSLPSALYLVAPEFGIRQIGYRTENAGASMADGYARVSHKVAVVTGQNGPAAALLVSGLAEALKASVPVVALVQDVRRTQTDKNAFQDLDHPDLFRACSKWLRRVNELSRIDDYVDMAFTAAASGRPGPAVLLCPQDLLLEEAPSAAPAVRRRNLGSYPLDRVVADPARVAHAASMLASARSPSSSPVAACICRRRMRNSRICSRRLPSRSQRRAWAKAPSTSATRCRSA